MPAAETIAGLAAFAGRGAGTDAERRAASWLAEELRESGREALIEPFWCRPNWAFAHAWHVFLGLAGSLLSVHSPRIGGALILLALLSVIADWMLGFSPGRRLTPERASQNVVAGAPLEPQSGQVRVIITANYDAGRTGLAYRDRLRTSAAQFRQLTRGITPGWLGWVVLALVWLEAVVIFRLGGSRGTAIGLAQLIPTAALVLVLALLIDIGSSEFGPAGGDNASGVAVAVELARALDAAPPRRTRIELVLEGAGDGSGVGLRRHLRARKETIDAANTVVIGVAGSASGNPRWWASDGALVPLGSPGRLRTVCETIAERDPALHLTAHRGRGAAPGLAARIRRIPAIAIGCLENDGVSPRSHQRSDTAETVEDQALERAVEFGLLLIDEIDAHLARAASRPEARAA